MAYLLPLHAETLDAIVRWLESSQSGHLTPVERWRVLALMSQLAERPGQTTQELFVLLKTQDGVLARTAITHLECFCESSKITARPIKA